MAEPPFPWQDGHSWPSTSLPWLDDHSWPSHSFHGCHHRCLIACSPRAPSVGHEFFCLQWSFDKCPRCPALSLASALNSSTKVLAQQLVKHMHNCLRCGSRGLSPQERTTRYHQSIGDARRARPERRIICHDTHTPACTSRSRPTGSTKKSVGCLSENNRCHSSPLLTPCRHPLHLPDRPLLPPHRQAPRPPARVRQVNVSL